MTAATAQVVDQHGHAIDTTDIYGVTTVWVLLKLPPPLSPSSWVMN